MALVSDGYHSSASLIDQGGQISTLSYEFNPVTITTLDLALTAQLAMNTALLGLTKSKLKTYSVSQRFSEDALTLPTEAQNENKMSLSFTKSGFGTGNLKVPAIADGAFVGATGAPNNQIKLDAAIVTGYTDKFKDGDDYVINDGEFLVELVKGKRVFSKNNKA